MEKDSKQPLNQMNPMGEWGESGDLFGLEVPVWYEKSGKVSSEWLSMCEEERNQTSGLLEEIANPSNLVKAYKQVKGNGGSGGIDRMGVKEFGEWLGTNLSKLQNQILREEYQPSAVRGVKIPKPKGGFRQLGIPTVKDRVIQQAISQVLQPIYDPKFSTNSYGFRPNRNAHQALRKASQIVKSGKTIVVDLDLAKFFDEVNHQRLL